MVPKKTHWIVLITVLILAAAMRLCSLTENPPGLNWDEVSHAYNAYSLLQTGRDQWGTAFPFPNFRAYGDYPTVLNVYLTVPAVFLFGLTDFAVRFPHALIGVVSCLAIFIAAYLWSRNKCLSLFAAFLYAVSPWTFFPSRAVFQSNWTVLLLTLSLALYHSRHKLLSVFFLALSLFAYHNTRIFVPLILPVFIYPLRKNKSMLIAGIITFSLSVILLLSPQVRARGSWVGIIDSGAVAYLEESRNLSQLSPLLSRLVFNRPVYFVSKFTQNYLGYFSPRFLFLSGGTQYQFSVPGYGLLNPALLPFFYLGIVILFKRRQFLLLAWLLLSPVPAALTRDSYAVIRSTAMIPAVMLTSALGVLFISQRLKRFGHWVFWLGFLLVFSFSGYYRTYFISYPQSHSRDWQYGYRQLVNYLRPEFAKYDRIVITKYYAEPHEYILWYWPWSAAAYQNDPNLNWDYHSSWYWVDGFSKFVFVNDWELSDYVSNLSPDKKTLIVASPQSHTLGTQLAVINFLNSDPAFIIKVY